MLRCIESVASEKLPRIYAEISDHFLIMPSKSVAHNLPPTSRGSTQPIGVSGSCLPESEMHEVGSYGKITTNLH